MRSLVKSHETLDGLLTVWARREGMTDRQLAAELGVSAPTISHWRDGYSAPAWTKWTLIADRSGRSVEEVALAIARGVKSLTTPSDDATSSQGKR